ncbi:MerR family transcriptional regulator [Ruminococcus sp. OA3]|uniref:MerR family transcriptional regulator n=1 Tax=Ruminococcus sp. OA3 TaxID=2914164 RepID=UPI001F066C5A|nr:effector binding domain-containing protein [Ruminococcus sp. OA3]MCH1981289.1 MerR family transcriptional regulator [Ruminococcus sp. OA3]
MFKIGEFSKLTQVSVRMLRYYDENNLLKPAQVDPFTGYRLYSVDQMPLLNRIIFLRDSGFNVAEITEALNNWDDDTVIQLLENKRIELEKNIQDQKQKISRIELAKADLKHEKSDMPCNISIKSIPSYQVLSLRKMIPDYYAEGQLWKEMAGFAGSRHIQVTGNTFSIYHDAEYKETNVDVELCAPVSRMEDSRDGFIFRNTEAFPCMASTMVYGPFENISGAYLAFARWLQENSQFQMLDTSRQIVHRGPWNEENPEHYLVELQIPLKNN